jgi:hypothetical protein
VDRHAVRLGPVAKGVGCDCKGLSPASRASSAARKADSFYAAFANYRVDRPVPAALLLEGFEALFDR